MTDAEADKIGALETRMGSLETRVEALDTRMGSLEVRVGALETRMTRLEALYEGLDRRVSDIQASLRLGLQIVVGGFIAVLGAVIGVAFLAP